MCCTRLSQWLISLYRDVKDGEIIGIIVENKHINGLEINLGCVIITFNYWFSVFNVCCGLRSILMTSALHRALISTSGATNINHLKPVIEYYINNTLAAFLKLRQYYVNHVDESLIN